MSVTCQQCGNVFEQQVNFCRKCGAPVVTTSLKNLETVPLQAVGAQVTQEIGQASTDPLSTNPPTRPIAKSKAEKRDRLKTQEPASAPAQAAAQPASLLAATEVLPSPAAPVPPAAEPLAKINELSTAPPAPAKSKAGILIAVTLGLLAFAVGGWLWMKRSNAPAISEIAPVPSSSPAETSNTTTPLPSPVADVSPTIPIESATNQTATNAKPSASVKPTSKASVNATPVPQPNTYEIANAATPVPAPAKIEPTATPPAENLASFVEQGNRLAGTGQFSQAIQMYEKARRANPGNTDIYYLLGSAYHRSGDLANALESYRKCTSGNYAAVAANHVKNLEKKLSKAK